MHSNALIDAKGAHPSHDKFTVRGTSFVGQCGQVIHTSGRKILKTITLKSLSTLIASRRASPAGKRRAQNTACNAHKRYIPVTQLSSEPVVEWNAEALV